MIQEPIIPFVITHIIKETEDVTTFLLQAQNGAPVPYKAGQFLTFLFEDEFGVGRRSYSLSSSPVVDEPLAITLKRIPNGRYSRWFAERAKAGDAVYALAPTGQFVLPEENPDSHYYCLYAAGVGITPIYSIIKTILYRLTNAQILLFYSNTDATSTVFYNELMELSARFKERLHINWIFSSSKNLNKARLNKEVLPQWLQPHLNNSQSPLFYTCGPYDYMRMVTYGLEEMGYSQNVIRKEIFDISRPVLKAVPPDVAAHQVIIKDSEKNYPLLVQYPNTILKTAITQGIALPYSCETGKCGACTVQCTSGKVWMSYNEVLTDKELAEGKVLTCTGFPIGGDVVIEI